MRNKDLYGIINELAENSFYDLTGIDFVLALVKNVKKMEQEIEALDNIRKPSDKYKEYLKELNQLRLNFADKDVVTGKPRTVKTQDGREVYLVLEKIDEFNVEIDKLKASEKFENCIKEQEQKFKKFEDAVEKECTIKFEKISKKDLPAEITFKQVYIIDFMMNK